MKIVIKIGTCKLFRKRNFLEKSLDKNKQTF